MKLRNKSDSVTWGTDEQTVVWLQKEYQKELRTLRKKEGKERGVKCWHLHYRDRPSNTRLRGRGQSHRHVFHVCIQTKYLEQTDLWLVVA